MIQPARRCAYIYTACVEHTIPITLLRKFTGQSSYIHPSPASFPLVVGQKINGCGKQLDITKKDKKYACALQKNHSAMIQLAKSDAPGQDRTGDLNISPRCNAGSIRVKW